jgi:hypothetical protein
MSTTWNLTRAQIGAKVLQKVGTLARGETPDQDDLEIVYDALDALLKALPIFGYAWPRLAAGQTALPLVAATQQTTLPADYYGGAVISYLDASGNEVPLPLVPLAEWNAIVRKTDTAAYPLIGYLDNFNVLRTWPIQTVTRAGELVYQRVIDDGVTASPTGLAQIWLQGLIYGVAHEVGDEFGATEIQIKRWGEKWASHRTLCIMNQSYPQADSVTVRD